MEAVTTMLSNAVTVFGSCYDKQCTYCNSCRSVSSRLRCRTFRKVQTRCISKTIYISGVIQIAPLNFFERKLIN